MTKKILISMLLTASLVACGSKAKKTTMPENKGDATPEMKSSGSSTGGTTYGGAMKPTTPAKAGGADPCGG